MKLIDLFSSYAEPTLIKGVQAFNAGDLEGLGRAAHSVKSSACNLGAREVENLASTIEQLATQGESTPIKALLVDLEKAFSRAKERLDEVKKGLMQ